MRVDFYQLDRDPAPQVAALLAGKGLEAGSRVLIVAGDEALRQDTSRALWGAAPASFLANGLAGGKHDARQPILLADEITLANGADMLIFADGQWRSAGEEFLRVMLLFDASTIDDARGTWRHLGETEGVSRHFWKQDGGRWVEGP